MISLKEACRYANHLDSVATSLAYMFSNENNLFKVSEKHFKSKGCSTATDEVIEDTVERGFNQIQDIAYLYVKILNEKVKLAMAINNAKAENKLNWKEEGLNLDLDSAVEYNKKLRRLTDSSLKRLNNYKDEVIKSNARDYMINAEGNQVPYVYPVEKTKEVDYDKKIINDLYKKILDKTDKISSLIDQFMISEIVNIDPQFSIHDTTEEIIEKYIAGLDRD